MKHPLADKLEAFCELIRTYHGTLDLMSDEGLAALPNKLADALAYAEAARRITEPTDRLLDVGSGVGLPGVVIALALPDRRVTLVERRERRSAFLRLVVGRLGVENVQIVQADVQRWQADPFTVVSAQAVGSFHALYCLTRHLHAPVVTLLSRKGETWHEEVAVLEASLNCGSEAQTLAPLSAHGRLIGVRLEGGRSCRSSA